ncbi:MAG: hypothetical protein R6U11_06735 [Bacteroidales bacterium]
MSSKLLFVTTVAGLQYLEYALIYIYSIKRAYPEYDVMIYSWDDITPIRKGLKLLNAEKCVKKIGFPYERSVKNYAKSRFLLGKHYFKNNKFAYIGDVDFFICKETPTILELHKSRLIQTGYCYSNEVRENMKRLTGLHFIDVDRYFNYTDSERIKAKKAIQEGDNSKTDEMMLYDMCEKSKAGLIPGNVRPHHGIHLGHVRQLLCKKNKRRKKGKNNIAQIRQSYRMQFIDAYENDPLFQKLITGLSIEKDIKLLYENLCN